MAENEQPDRTKVTFSQAEGLAPLPWPLELGDLSQQARAVLWKFMYEEMPRSRHSQAPGSSPQVIDPWRSILYDWHVFEEHRAADDFSHNFFDNLERVKAIILNGDFNVVFDFLQFVMRHGKCPDKFDKAIGTIFRYAQLAYFVSEGGPTIMPAATPEEGAAIQEALRVSSEAGLDGARVHLVKAGEELNAGHFPDSVRESVHAVESVAKRLSEKADTTLSPALDALSQHVTIHGDLIAGFKKIYGYTSDEKGVRHALLGGKAKVDREDAVFMLGACASFVTYLVGKARASGLIKE